MNSPPPPRFRRRKARWARWIVPLLAALALLATRYLGDDPATPSRFDATPLAAGEYEVDRVVDGDTLIVRVDEAGKPKRVRVRLLGIDAPESVKPDHPVEPGGPEATALASDFLAGGRVRLEFDRRRVDRYGRHLAYVYVGEQMLNEVLVAAGWARVSAFAGDNASIALRLKKAEAAARQDGRGIWAR